MWIDIARTGTFTAGNNGQKVAFTTECFDRLIRSFDEKTRRVPLVFGHPTNNTPAYGWVEALRRAGNTLQAKFKQVHDDVKTLVRNGNFKNISISISSDKSFLHHVGLLGATQPAIPGLREVSFSDGINCLIFEFSQEELQDELTRLKEEVAQLKAQLEQQQGQEEEKDKEGKLERLKNMVNQGKVSPAEFALLEPFAMALLESNSMLTFAAGPEPVHPVDALIDILEAREKSLLFMNYGDFMTPWHIAESEDGKGDPAAQKIKNPAYII
jgi:hypothetical protein